MRTHLLSVLLSVVAVGRSPPSAVHSLVLETGRHLTSRHSSLLRGTASRADELPSRSHVD